MCENRKVNLTTGNPVVDAVGKMHFMGNVIPENWFKTVVSETGKVHLLAILVLSEIVYWYKPTEVRDEKTGDVRWKKKFEATDFLQKSYSALEGKFNASHKQIRDALITLERLGVVKRNLRNIETKLGKCPNVLYLELNPEALYRLTFTSVDDESADGAGVDGESVGNELPDHESSDDNGIDKKVNTSSAESSSHGTNEEDFADSKQNDDMTSLQDDDDMLTKKETCPAPIAPTNTENTTKTTTSFSTTAHAREAVVAEAVEVFATIGLDEKDIRTIVKASGYNINKCKGAKAVYDKQRKPIDNVTGWLKTAVKKGYKLTPRIPPAKNGFNNFEMQIYDAATINALEDELLSNNY